MLDALKLPKPPKLEDVTAPKAAATSDVVDKKDASDDTTVTGTTSEPTTKADDTTASSGRHRKSPFGSHRDRGANTATDREGVGQQHRRQERRQVTPTGHWLPLPGASGFLVCAAG